MSLGYACINIGLGEQGINTYGKDFNIVLETKIKELALLKYREQFGNGEV